MPTNYNTYLYAQALFYIDEVAPFIPPVRKPACKSALTLIFKQARKYGVSCLMATQNPGDVDYKAMSQFATWAIGRLSTRQDIKKVYPTVKSIDSKHADQIMDALPSLQAGEFMLLSPDHFDHGVHMKTRWLYTPHETLDERRIEALCDEHWRERFLALEQKMKHRTQEGAKDHESTAAQANSDAGSSQNTDAQTDQTTNLVEDSDTKSTAKSSSKLSSKPSKKSSKKSSTRTSKTPSHDANNDTTHDESSSKDQMTNHDQQSILAYLTSHDTCDVKTIAHELSVSENKARTVLKNLEKNKKIKSYKMGRSVHYFSLTAGGRPDLDLAREVKSFIPKLSESQMLNIAEENRAKSFLGLIGSEEKFLEKTLCYHVLYQVAFSEIVSAGIFSFFSNDKQVEDYIYIEPETLKILVYQPDKPIELVDKPAEHASEIKDFDGVADIKMIAPADVRFNIDAWKARQPIDVVKNSIQKRFQLNISHVEPIFLPLWALRYQIQGSHQVRVIRVDALTGKQIIL